MRYQTTLTIPITVARDSREPLHEQIATQVGTAVEHGLLAGHTRLPSTRTLAELLGVSRGVATAAYELLFTRGYLESQPGSGTYVSPRHAGEPAPPAAVRSEVPVDLRPGQVNTEAFPLSAWRAAWRQASFRRPPMRALPALGMAELRRVVGEHVSRTHGVSLAGREVVITGGTAHGLRVVLDALGLRGRQVAVEEPAPPALYRAAGGDADPPAAVPVDGEGARLDAVPVACRALVVSPDAQVPLGNPLSAGRRLQAAAWAADTGGHLVEIARDTGFRPGAGRVGRPFSAAGVLLGGFCELLTPTLKLGYAIVPRELADAVARRIAERAEQPPHVTQLAVAALLQDGTVVRLMHRLGRLYADRRELVGSALGGLRGVRYDGRDAVHTAVLYLSRQADAERAAADLLRRGVRVTTLRPYHFSGRAVPPALVVGYGHPAEADLRRALPVLRAALATPPPPPPPPLPPRS
jgi:GntR family transcriptional regulator/MocR family aminotransferase